jgi:hypothetical protein
MSTSGDALLSAEVILKSISGNSLATNERSVTASNIEKYRASKISVETVVRELKKLGFSVPQAGVTISIVGTAKQFEKAFKIKPKIILMQDKYEVKVNRDPVIPKSLEDTVEKIIFPPAPEYFK